MEVKPLNCQRMLCMQWVMLPWQRTMWIIWEWRPSRSGPQKTLARNLWKIYTTSGKVPASLPVWVTPLWMTSNTRIDHGHRDNSPHHIVIIYFWIMYHMLNRFHVGDYMRRYNWGGFHFLIITVLQCIVFNMCKGKHEDSVYVYMYKQ